MVNINSVLLIFIVTMFSAASAMDNAFSTISVPEDALGLKTEELNMAVGMRNRPSKFSYHLSKVFPDQNIVSYYKDKYAAYGWRLCKKRKQDAEKYLWTDYTKMVSGDSKSMIRRAEFYMVNKTNQSITTIALSYFGSIVGNNTKTVDWNFKTQHVDVTAYSYMSVKFEEIMMVFSNAGWHCQY